MRWYWVLHYTFLEFICDLFGHRWNSRLYRYYKFCTRCHEIINAKPETFRSKYYF